MVQNSKKMRIVCFLAREHGLDALKKIYLDSNYKILCLFTHRLQPKSIDPLRQVRTEFEAYKTLAELYRTPMQVVDSKKDCEDFPRVFREIGEFDAILSISWRYLIPGEILRQAKLGAVNLHRGKLPNYPGEKPIEQALKHGDDEIIITAHEMTEIIDQGKTLAVARHPVGYQRDQSLEENIERLKAEITPLFGPLTQIALQLLAVRS